MTVDEKIWGLEDLQDRVQELPRPIVMTNGVFDVIHRGHISYLQGASHMGKTLIVAVNTDRSVRMLNKGPDRPLNTEVDRAYVLAAIEFVDLVVLFDARKPTEIIRTVRPDVYVKGGDYDIETLEETHIVRSWGGLSVTLPYETGFSTTELLRRVRGA